MIFERFRWLIGVFFSIIAIIVIYGGLAYWQDESNIDPSVMHRKVAVIYAAPTFHEEVVSSAACIMHELGYHTVVYIGNGYQFGGMMVPFSGRRKRDSEAFYGRCVSQFVTIRSPLMMVQNPSIIVFVTYPMMEMHKEHSVDQNALDILRYVRDQKLDTPIVLITHHSEAYLNDTNPIFDLVSPEQTTFMFLGEHTMKDAQKVTRERVPAKDVSKYHLSHFYPTVPMHYIAGDQEALSLLENHPQQKDDTVLVIQGHFGGKHAHRKDPLSVIECLKQIEDGYVPAGSVAHKDNKHPSLNIDLIGRLLGKVEVGSLKHSRVTFLSDLSSAEYYKAIARARFMVAAIREHTYYTEKATSSVPAAMITEIPLVTTREFLNVYPCLREGAIHQKINRNEDECASVYEAVHLSDLEYQSAKDEMKYCNNKLWEEAKTAFSDLIVKKNQRMGQQQPIFVDKLGTVTTTSSSSGAVESVGAGSVATSAAVVSVASKESVSPPSIVPDTVSTVATAATTQNIRGSVKNARSV